ncbi:MAG TPA: SPASM domain-containing protein, partial [Oligoflexia bacterium]|nr:SPASM domain-containing protein [Oligoflexia bacterium]
LSRSSKLRHVYKRWLILKAALSMIIWRRATLPGFIAIDPGNICNLQCPLCPTGSNRSDYPKGVLTFEGFKTLLNRAGKIRMLALTVRGEPLLNQDIFQMISYARSKNIVVEIHSHFSLEKDACFFEHLVSSGLDVLSLSIDGVSQECYARYRKGGDVELVKRNILTLLEVKKRLRSRTPFVVWQYLYHRFNSHEIAEARALAKKLTMRFRLLPLRGYLMLADLKADDATSQSDYDEYWQDLNDCQVRKDLASPLYTWSWTARLRCCELLLTLPMINWDGGVFACCLLSKKESVFGNLYEEELGAIWNGAKYRSARLWTMYKKKELVEEDSPCLGCPHRF